MERYNIYQPMHTQAAGYLREQFKDDKRLCRETFGKPLKKVERRAIEDQVFHNLVGVLPGMTELAILLEEWCWREDGRHVYFPMPGMLEELHHAHFSIDLEELVIPRRTFSVAVPSKDRVGGLELPGFMITYFDLAGKTEVARQFGMQFTGEPLKMDPGSTEHNEYSVFLTYRDKKEMSIRMSAPMSRFNRLLNECAGTTNQVELIREIIGTYDVPGMVPLTDEEVELQARIIKALVGLCIYMKICPEAVISGYPEMLNRGELPVRNPSAQTVGQRDFSGIRHGPRAHYRRWHFRRYPRRRDGSRKSGTVMVRGAMVGPREHPHTVLN